MKKFKYSLQKLFNMRLRMEKEASQQFMDISSRIKTINQNIDDLNDLYNKNAFTKCSTKIEDIIRNNYLQYIENSILVNESEKKKMTKIYEEKFDNYKQKKKDKMVLENLRDKEYYNYLKESDKEEQDFLDEISLGMYYKDFKEGEDDEYEDDEYDN